MDRWGPSEDCEVCGQPQSFGHFVRCEKCGKDMCPACFKEHEWCRDNTHECKDVYSDEIEIINTITKIRNS